MEGIADGDPDPHWEFATKMRGQQQCCKHRFVRKFSKKYRNKSDDCVLKHAVTN
jgi:hypothetical protein